MMCCLVLLGRQERSMRYLTSGLFLVGCVLSSRQAAAHFELLFPPSRAPTEIDNYPCGSKGATRGTVTNLRPGQKITVQWKVGVEHTMPGKWRFAIDDSGQDFPVPGSDTSALPLVMDNLAFTGLGMHEQVVEIPNIQCTNCVFQVIQYTSIETSYTADNFYYQCGDITIGGEPTGTTVGTGATTSTATTTG